MARWAFAPSNIKPANPKTKNSALLTTFQKFGILKKPIVSIKQIKYSPKEVISKLIVESPLLKNIYNFSIQNHINTFEKSGIITSSEKIAISTINGVVISLIFSIDIR